MLTRITGFSFPAGVSWKPTADERDIAQRLIKYLADRRCLYLPFSLEVYGWVIESILEIRKRLSADLESVSMDSPLGQSIASMQAVCRKFLTDEP